MAQKVGKAEKAARRALIEEMFDEYRSSRLKTFGFMFLRGVFFGVGSLVGGTIVVAGIIWFLSQFLGIPGIGEYIQPVVDTVQDR